MTLNAEKELFHSDQKWIQKGVDIWMIRDNLKLSFEERIAQHQNTLEVICSLKQMSLKNYTRSPLITSLSD